MLFVVKCYDNKMVKSLIDPTIIPLIGARGGEPITKKSAPQKAGEKTSKFHTKSNGLGKLLLHNFTH